MTSEVASRCCNFAFCCSRFIPDLIDVCQSEMFGVGWARSLVPGRTYVADGGRESGRSIAVRSTVTVSIPRRTVSTVCCYRPRRESRLLHFWSVSGVRTSVLSISGDTRRGRCPVSRRYSHVFRTRAGNALELETRARYQNGSNRYLDRHDFYI